MKSFLHTILVILFAGATLSGCSKDEDVAPVPTLEVTLTDEAGKPVSGATVKLYSTETDLEKKTNQIGSSQTSSAEGKVKFKNLEAIKYFWYAEKDCMNNYYGEQESTALVANKTNAVTSVLIPTGTYILVNNSSNPYDIFINGKFVFTATGGKSYTYSPFPSGTFMVEAVQKSGYLFEATKKYEKSTIPCGNTVTWKFPN